MTAKQELALMLEKAGYTHERIAVELRVKHRQRVGELLKRAHERQDAIRQAALDLLGESA